MRSNMLSFVSKNARVAGKKGRRQHVVRFNHTSRFLSVWAEKVTKLLPLKLSSKNDENKFRNSGSEGLMAQPRLRICTKSLLAV